MRTRDPKWVKKALKIDEISFFKITPFPSDKPEQLYVTPSPSAHHTFSSLMFRIEMNEMHDQFLRIVIMKGGLFEWILTYSLGYNDHSTSRTCKRWVSCSRLILCSFPPTHLTLFSTRWFCYNGYVSGISPKEARNDSSFATSRCFGFKRANNATIIITGSQQ